jgi:adenylylsulfate kinase
VSHIKSNNNNLTWHRVSVKRADREKLNGHRSAVLWFTGLSGSGKSTLAHAVEERLYQIGCRTFVFDGDNVRHGLNRDLGFSAADREENIRRIGEMVRLFVQAGVIALAAFISPFRAGRRQVRELLNEDDFLEIYCRCPVEVCEKRDAKGLYRRARSGEIENYTGSSSPYEEPEHPDLIVETHKHSLEESIRQVIDLLIKKQIINSGDESKKILLEVK